MAIKWPLADGLWSDESNWNDGTKPVAGDVVYADGKTITIDENLTVAQLRTEARSGGTTGGGFSTSGYVVVNADSYAGSSICLMLNSLGIQNGSSYSGATNSVYGTRIRAFGVQNGNATGGSGLSAHGTLVELGGIHNGHSFGGSGNASCGTSLVGGIKSGDSTAGAGANSHGTYVSAGSVAIVGTSTGPTANASGVFSTGAYQIVTIRNEVGAYAKSLGASTDTTFANIPFAQSVVFNTSALQAGNRVAQSREIKPSVAPRLGFFVIGSNGDPVTDLVTAGITSAAYVTITGGVRSSASTITLGSKVADTASHSTGQLVVIRPSEGWYAIDAPAGAALATADYAELVVVLTDSSRLVYPTMHPIDSSVSDVPASIRTELATELARIDVAVSTRNAVTPPTVAQLNARTLPTADYFAPSTDTVARVTLVDTVTANTDMRGTDGANTATPPTASAIATAVWAAGTRTLTAISDSSGITTLLSRVTGLLRTKAQADAANDAIPDAVRTELATELAHIDADISSRNATAPDNTGIAAIQADVDALPKYGDTTKRTLVSDSPTELTETITRVP